MKKSYFSNLLYLKSLAMRFFVVVVFCSVAFSVFSQESPEQLEQRMNQAQGEEQLQLMITLGKLYSVSDPDKSLELGLKATIIAKRMGNLHFEGQALLLMGLSSLNAGQQENALRYYNRALSHFERLNQGREQITSLQGIAEVYSIARNFELAINYLNRALIIAKNMRLVDNQIAIYENIGVLAMNQKDYSLSLSEFSKVQQLLGDDSRLDSEKLRVKANTYRQMGYAQRNLGQLKESLILYRKSATLEQKLNNPAQENSDLFEIAFSYFLLQELDSALTYYNQVLAYSQLRSDTLVMVKVLQSIGDVFFEKEQYRQAIASFHRSLELANNLNSKQDQVSALVNISRCFNAIGDYPSSKEYLNRALIIATRENLTNTAADVYRYISQVYEQEGRFMQALEFYKLWADLRDSLYSEESGQKMARMQILYEITQKERENEILKQNSEIQELQLVKARYQTLIFVTLALFLFALLILLGFFYRIKQKEYLKQKETELRIVELNKELEKRMIAEIKKQEKQQLLLAQKSKLESLGTLAAGIAHEINQPLGGISMGLDNILIRLTEKSYTETYLSEKVNLMFENVERIKRIIDHVRTFSRAYKLSTFERVDLNEVIRNALIMVKTQYEKNGVKIDVNLNLNIESIFADKFKLEQVVLNFLSNSKHAVEEKDTQMHGIMNGYQKIIEVSTYDDEKNVYLKVKDNGIGIKQKDVEKIFDPFFTTKTEEKGTGLGLAISYGFIKDILGDIKVESKEGEFTSIEVMIPKS